MNKEMTQSDWKKLHGRKVELRVEKEGEYLILFAIDDRTKTVYIMSVEKEES